MGPTVLRVMSHLVLHWHNRPSVGPTTKLGGQKICTYCGTGRNIPSQAAWTPLIQDGTNNDPHQVNQLWN